MSECDRIPVLSLSSGLAALFLSAALYGSHRQLLLRTRINISQKQLPVVAGMVIIHLICVVRVVRVHSLGESESIYETFS